MSVLSLNRSLCYFARKGCFKSSLQTFNFSNRQYQEIKFIEFDLRLRNVLMKIKDHQHSVLKDSKDSISLKKILENKGLQPHKFQALIELAETLVKTENEINELKNLARDNEAGLLEVIGEEKSRLEGCLDHIKETVTDIILPDNTIEMDGITMEITAGVGGQEAMLFCRDLLDMYSDYCEVQGWEYSVVDCEKTGIDGVRHASLNIEDQAAYNRLKFESGVHRVQRIPKTEKSGRIHTSTASVAILPKPTQVTITIDPKDLKIDTKRAGGAGGQHVNTTESAVRVTHLPTGVVVECQTQRSQTMNREVAISTLKARLYQKELDKQLSSQQSSRRLQVGTSGRSEKIRTYNIPQDRITDHRINFTTHNTAEFMRAGRPLENLLHQLLEESRRDRLDEFLNTVNG